MARKRLPPRTTRSPTGSGPLSRSDPLLSPVTMSISAPISRSTSTIARRDGLRLTSTRRSSASGCRAAATSHAAADEMSPGTVSDRARSAPGPSIVVVRPSRRTDAPSHASSRSVWSRVGPGDSMVVVPSAASAASVIAPRTCALATGSWWSIARSGRRPWMVSGACPSVVVTAAPICRRGPATRSIGRRESDSSPLSVAAFAARPASAPQSSRMVVPEFPQSSSSLPTPGNAAPALLPPPRTR